MSEWQPIKTAPKDGSSILTLMAGYEPSITQWYIDDTGVGKWVIDPEYFMEESHFLEFLHGTSYSPNYWMPLPEPPRD